MKELARTSARLMLGACAASGPAVAEPILLNTLEWPPYASASLPAEGAASSVVSAAMEKIGRDVSFVFLPWKRAIAGAKDGKRALGYFPGYSCDHAPGFVASAPIGSGPLGFAEPGSDPVAWAGLDDLAGQDLRIGVVLGYKNSDGFDRRVEQGAIHAVTAKDDATNLRNLKDQRIDAAVVDKRVMQFLVATQSDLGSSSAGLQFNANLLSNETMHVCFAETKAGLALKEEFDAAVRELSGDVLMDAYLNREF